MNEYELHRANLDAWYAVGGVLIGSQQRDDLSVIMIGALAAVTDPDTWRSCLETARRHACPDPLDLPRACGYCRRLTGHEPLCPTRSESASTEAGS